MRKTKEDLKASKIKKERVAMLSVLSNTTLIILKVISGILSGSVSIISEAIHSGMDLMASLIALFSVKVSSNPADCDHPYGHGKIENVSGVIEGLLIFVAAFLIIKEAIAKIINPTEIKETSIAIIVMLISAVVNVIVSRILYKVAKEEDSVALEADALHLKTDVYTSLGVAAGLILIKITNISILDPIAAILVALLIVSEALHLVKNAFGPLLDSKLCEEEENEIKRVLLTYKEQVLDVHNLRTRRSGNIKIIDFHLVMHKELTIAESHVICEQIEEEIERTLSNVNIQIHVEPDDHLDKKESESIW